PLYRNRGSRERAATEQARSQGAEEAGSSPRLRGSVALFLAGAAAGRAGLLRLALAVVADRGGALAAAGRAGREGLRIAAAAFAVLALRGAALADHAADHAFA